MQPNKNRLKKESIVNKSAAYVLRHVTVFHNSSCYPDLGHHFSILIEQTALNKRL